MKKRMLSAIFLIILIIGITACADKKDVDTVNGFKYAHDAGTGEITITAYLGKDVDVLIPKMIDEKNVTIIAYNTFKDCQNIKTVTVPDSVKKIGTSAFSGCINLTDITLPNSIIEMDGFVFSNCENLTNIILPESVTIINQYLFNKCRSLSSITIPESVTRIENQAFANCENLAYITIPENVTYIGAGIFKGCKNLKTVNILAKRENVELYEITIEDIQIDPNKKYYGNPNDIHTYTDGEPVSAFDFCDAEIIWADS